MELPKNWRDRLALYSSSIFEAGGILGPALLKIRTRNSTGEVVRFNVGLNAGGRLMSALIYQRLGSARSLCFFMVEQK